MSDVSFNLTLSLSIRRYRDKNYGKRKLGPGRYALDCGHWSLILEAF